jgi:hypothetical protein
MAEGHGEHDHPPEVLQGIVVAAATACLVETSQEAVIGQDLEELAERGQLGVVFELGPSEQGIGSV